MKKTFVRNMVGMTVGVSMISACATVGGQPLTTQQKMMSCATMVAGGAVLGAIIGNNVGDGDAGAGALAGGLIGAGACGVWLAFNNEADKRRMAEAQLAAIQQNETVSSSWKGADGRERSVTIVPSTETQMIPVSASGTQEPAAPMICRPLQTTASYNNNSDTMTEIWCRDADGNYAAATQQMVPAV